MAKETAFAINAAKTAVSLLVFEKIIAYAAISTANAKISEIRSTEK